MDDHDVLLSVIIPVFNSEKHLPGLIKHLINLDRTEVIFIDDGSDDCSSFIIDESLSLFTKARLIKATHGGVSRARNVGIATATGRYITFIDADDEIDVETLNSIIRDYLANDDTEWDVVFNTEDSIVKITESISEDYRKNLVLLLLKLRNNIPTEGINPAPFNKFYLTEFVKNNGIIFNVDLVMGEDMLFNVAIAQNAQNALWISREFYKYSPTDASVSRKLNFDILKNTSAFLYGLSLLTDFQMVSWKAADSIVMDGIRIIQRDHSMELIGNLVTLANEFQANPKKLKLKKKLLYAFLMSERLRRLSGLLLKIKKSK